MRLDCPHCGSRLDLSPADHGITNAAGVNHRLQGGELTCETCENELGVYYF